MPDLRRVPATRSLLRHMEKIEPLIGVYDTSLEKAIRPLIMEHGAPVRTLTQLAVPTYFDYVGPEGFLLNCNTLEQFSEVQSSFDGLNLKNLLY